VRRLQRQALRRRHAQLLVQRLHGLAAGRLPVEPQRQLLLLRRRLVLLPALLLLQGESNPKLSNSSRDLVV